jgi:hypothetical protein
MGGTYASGQLLTGTSGSFAFSSTVGTVDGCTDTLATNYDACANNDDGSCVYPCADNDVTITVGGGSWMSEVGWSLIDGSGVTVASGGAPFTGTFCLADDCYTMDMTDSYGDGWNGSTYSIDDNNTGTNYGTGGLTAGMSAGSDLVSIGAACAVYGCTDSTATNYDPLADTDDGSCTYTCASQGLDEISINLYDSYGDGWNGNTLTVDGIDYTIAGWASSESFVVCADLSTCITATYNNTGFYASENSWDITDASGTVLISGGNIGSGGDFGNCCVYGCTDMTANNYDAAATCDDGTCTYNSGCTDPLACNYDSTAVVDDGSCLTAYGCTDTTMFNYDPLATCSDNSTCIAFVYGCTDATALNYYAGANSDDGSCVYVAGCMDATACNYDPLADFDDGSCEWTSCSGVCANDPISGLGVTGIIHNQATFTFDNMNTYDAMGVQVCRVDQLRIQYREVGTNSWSQKNMGSPTGYDPLTGICNSTQNTSKLTLGLSSSTTYEWNMKVWYCASGGTAWVAGPNFTTADDCPNVGNFAVSTPLTDRATFTWDDANGAYSFVRIKLRVDSISNPTGADWTSAGGLGVAYGTWTKNKNGLTPGETYRGQSRTWCNPNGGPYKAPYWSSLIWWTQPTSVRVEGGSAINNLDVYPNPSRDIFNVTFTSEDAQDLEVRVLNVVGEVVYTENLQQFVGEYTKAIDLATYTKGIYFLEITTNNGVVNKKLILQ